MKACVIGAGIGGLSTASLLLREGWDVEVYEREQIPGGRALSSTLDEGYENLLKKFSMRVASSEPSMEDIPGVAEGYTLDLGFHLIGGGKRGACVRLLRELGVDIPFAGSRLGLIDREVSYPIVHAADKFAMLPRIMQLLFTRKSKIEEMKRMSVEQLIEKYGRGKLTLLLELFPRLITTVNDLSRISAGEMLFAQRELMGGDPVIYPYGGLHRISEALAAYISHNGGEIHCKRKVGRICIEEGTAVGVKVGRAERRYDAVISTIPVQHLFTVADKQAFPEEWVAYVRHLHPTGSVVSYHAVSELNENLLNKSFVFIERDADFEGGSVVGMIDFKMHHLTGMAPPGKYLIQSYAICTPEEAKSRSKREELISIIEKYVAELMPTNRRNLEWSIHSAIWHLDGVAKTIDCMKPDVVTPINNLYLAGDCVNSRGVGINCAADSARLVLEALRH